MPSSAPKQCQATGGRSGCLWSRRADAASAPSRAKPGAPKRLNEVQDALAGIPQGPDDGPSNCFSRKRQWPKSPWRVKEGRRGRGWGIEGYLDDHCSSPRLLENLSLFASATSPRTTLDRSPVRSRLEIQKRRETALCWRCLSSSCSPRSLHLQHPHRQPWT